MQSTTEVPQVYQASYAVDGYADTIVHEDLATTVEHLAAYAPVAVVAGVSSAWNSRTRSARHSDSPATAWS